MNAHDVALDTIARQPTAWRTAALMRRTLLLTLIAMQSALAASVMLAVLPYHGGNAVEIALVTLFTLLFIWLSFGFWVGVYGFALRLLGGDRRSLARRHPAATLRDVALARTAILLPVYHEPIGRTLNGLRAIYESLAATGELDHFDFFILSDSRNPEVWLNEQIAWHELVEQLGAQGRIFYRRRILNQKYKSGNVSDFLRRWGNRYQYALVLDADSLMGGDTIVQMVRLMQCEPRVGILQSSPQLANAHSLFARTQQFANQLFGPIFTTGLAAVQLGDATFWGHNAILRCAPFMQHCGLRRLRGPGLFNGPIASHDFVEAALLGKAGYEVWLEPSLGDSYEESPPSLVDELTRDKRWAKGNLQHLWLIFRPGLRFAHRLAFLNGVMSYLAAPLWFLFLALATVETAQLVLWPINYFPEEYNPFPLWPEWNPRWAIGLFIVTLILLFLPKLLAAIDVLRQHRSRQFGGLRNLLLSLLLESVISALLAPIRMLAHTRYVIEALLNVQLRWAGQNRSNETRWSQAIVSQLPAALLALAWATFAYRLSPGFFYWSLPVAGPLILSAPTSVLLSRTAIGHWMWQHGLFVTPPEVRYSRLLNRVQNAPPLLREQGSAIELAVLNPRCNAIHIANARHCRAGIRAAALADCTERMLADGPMALDARELTLALRDRATLRQLHHRAWNSPPASYWGRAIARYAYERNVSAPSHPIDQKMNRQ